MSLTARQRLALWSYQAGFHFFLPLGLLLGLPLWLFRRKRRLTILPRLGFQRIGLTRSGPRPVWMHALSIGETLSAVTLVREMRQRLGERPLVFSVSTLAAKELAEERLAGRVDRIFYLPLDLVPCVAKVLGQVRPAALVVVETDIWPGLLHAVRHRGFPAFLVNGRVSPQSFRSFRRWRTLFEPALNVFETIFPQSEGEAARYRAVGVQPKKIGAAGNLKFDAAAARPGAERFQEIRRECGVAEGDRVWVAGSTHPGEEEAVLGVYRHLRSEHPGLRLILVPRHPHRGAEVRALCEHAGFAGKLYTEDPPPTEDEVLIVDAMGRLSELYELAEMAFVGGSLVNRGGQNPIEPAAAGKPVLFGPDMTDFPDAAAELLERDAAFQVQDREELLERMRRLLREPESSRRMGSRGEQWVESHRGTTARIAEHILVRIQTDRR